MKKNQSPQKLITWWDADRYDVTALFICLATFIGWIILLFVKYFSFGYSDWDFAIYAQLMWNLTNGSTYPSLFGMNFLANHAQYIAFVLVPIYALFSHPLTLIVLKTLSYTAGAGILYILAKKHLHGLMSLVVMILFLFFPANIYAMLFEFDFESLSIGLLLLLFYFFQAENFKGFCITMVVAALIKENIPAVIVAFGFYALCSKRKNKLKWGLLPIVWGAGFFYLTMFMITPYLRIHQESSNAYLGLYQHLGTTPLEIIKTFLFHPFKILKIIFIPTNVAFLDELFRPLLFLPLLSPHVLFLIFPILLEHLLSTNEAEHTIFYHYAATMVPFIFLATVQSLTWIEKKAKPILFSCIVSLLLLVFALNLASHRQTIANRILYFEDPTDPYLWQMIKKIPQDAEVVSTFRPLIELSQRKSIYTFLNVIQNRKGLSWLPFQLPETVSYALIDFEDAWIHDEIFLHSTNPDIPLSRIQTFLNDDWGIKDAVNDIILFQKGELNHDKLIERSTTPFLDLEHPQDVLIDDHFFLNQFGINYTRSQRKEILPLTFYWNSKKDLTKDYLMTLTFKQKNQVIFRHTRRIGYTVFPTRTWRQGDYIKEHYWLLLPRMKPGKYTIGINFFNEQTQTFSILKNMEGSTDQNTLKVGEFFVR